MKKLFFFSLLIFYFLPGRTFSQSTTHYTIPSFNIEIAGDSFDVVSQEIDDRLWGSRIIPDSEMVVSVWID